MPRFGPYELLERVGCGGMGEIYLSVLRRGDAFEKTVAIKRILPALSNDPAFVKMFDREARIAALLNHQNIVQIFDYGHEGDEYFIAMEYVEGADMRTLLARVGPPPLEAALTVLLGIARALDYAHRRCDRNNRPLDIVHRDVSPGNVLLSREGEVKLTDFGLVTGSLDDASSVAGEMKGKYAYMSPEQTYGDPVDLRSDLFSWAVVAHELLSGRRPFRGNILETVESIRRGDYTPLEADIPDALEQLLSSCLRVHREERPESAGELVRSLERLLVDSKRADANRRLCEWVTRGCPERPSLARALERTEVGDAPIHRAALEETQPAEVPVAELGPDATTVKRRSRRPWLLGLVGVVVAAAAIVLTLTTSDGDGQLPMPTPLSAAMPDADVVEEPLDASVRVADEPAVEPTAPQPAVLVLTSDPPEALVSIDGTVRGRTPFDAVWYEGGTHVIRLELPGHQAEERTFEAKLDTTTELAVELAPIYRVQIAGRPTVASARLTLVDGDDAECETPCELELLSPPVSLEVSKNGFLSFDVALASTAVVPGEVGIFDYELEPRERLISVSWRSRGVTLQGDRTLPLEEGEPVQQRIQFSDASRGYHGTLQAELLRTGDTVRVRLSVRSTPWSEMEFNGRTYQTPDEILEDGLEPGRHQLRLRPSGQEPAVSIDLVIRESTN